MAAPLCSDSSWRKSSYSDGGQTNCLEVADSVPGFVPVRDSKAPGPVILLSAPAWTVFINGLRRGTR